MRITGDYARLVRLTRPCRFPLSLLISADLLQWRFRRLLSQGFLMLGTRGR
jgi:hypothetical protein